MAQVEEPCSLGPLRDVIMPPTWVMRLPPRRISTFRKIRPPSAYSSSTSAESGQSGGGCGKRKKKSRKDKMFTVKACLGRSPDYNNPSSPLLIFVNPKSGGNKGAKILHNLYWLLNPRQVFDLAAVNGPKYGLEMYRKIVNKLKVVVCGGDGTVGWVLSTLDSLKWPVYPPIAVIPLGTGNDLSQTLGWGASFVDEPLSEILMAVADETSVVYLDRWSISTEPNKEATQSEEGASKNLPLSVMNNYFSIGADAQAALQFHESRMS
uniref:diacylglycerol kinase (ATP) n=1 Tax=Romanomermis culicivorax TaxID=13658 RepID=A0A915HTU3_ROMCU